MVLTNFRKVSGERVDVLEHTIEILKKNPTVNIHIGTDSQNFKSYTTYSTVIAYRYEMKGVHYIYNRTRMNKVKDRWERLWKEAEMSIEVAHWLKEQISVDIQIDLDYNTNKKYFSNQLISSTSGWASALGFKVNIKPDVQIATRAADFICR